MMDDSKDLGQTYENKFTVDLGFIVDDEKSSRMGRELGINDA